LKTGSSIFRLSLLTAVLTSAVLLTTACSSPVPVNSPKHRQYVSQIYRNSQLEVRDPTGITIDIFEKGQRFRGTVNLYLDGKKLAQGLYDFDFNKWFLNELAQEGVYNAYKELQNYCWDTCCVCFDEVFDLVIAGGNLYKANTQTVLEAPTAKTFVLYRMTGLVYPGADMVRPRHRHQMIYLSEEKVLIIGGQTTGGAAVQEVELFNAKDKTCRVVGLMSVPRRDFLLTKLNNGRILVSGGYGIDDKEGHGKLISTLEMYDPKSEKYTVPGQLQEARAQHHAITFGEGSALFFGGVVPAAAGESTSDTSAGATKDASTFEIVKF
jgi:hypothetical protein